LLARNVSRRVVVARSTSSEADVSGQDRDSREVRAVLATMIATVVSSRLPIEPFDDHQLTAVAITGGATAASSHLSRSCG